MDFYTCLNYTIGNEDWHVEEQALRVAPGDSVVCVTASGDRPLHLLMTECASVLSIDMNPIQNYLLDLKKTAIAHLDFEPYLEFLGCKPSKHRKELYNKLRPHLSKDASQFWDDHKNKIKNGIIYQGRTERFTNLAANVIALFWKSKITKLLSFDNIEEQRIYVNQQLKTAMWRKIFEFFLNPGLMKHLFNDPGLNSYVDSSIKPGKYIYERMLNYFDNHLAKKSPLFQLIFTGKVLPEAYFPYLTFDGYTKIRKNLDRLHYMTGNVIEHLTHNLHSEVNCFSMSDIASYMPQQVFEKLLNGMRNAAKEGARFCIRELMSKRTIPNNLMNHFERNSSLEKKMEFEESNFVYRFMAGEVRK